MSYFDQPVTPNERIKAAQVCPHCFGQVFSMFGTDLRVRGRCASCHRRLILLKGKVVTLREVAPYYVVVVVTLSALVWWAMS